MTTDDRWDLKCHRGPGGHAQTRPATISCRETLTAARGPLCTPSLWAIEPADEGQTRPLWGSPGQSPQTRGEPGPWVAAPTQQAFSWARAQGSGPALALPTLTEVQGLRSPSADGLGHSCPRGLRLSLPLAPGQPLGCGQTLAQLRWEGQAGLPPPGGPPHLPAHQGYGSQAWLSSSAGPCVRGPQEETPVCGEESVP